MKKKVFSFLMVVLFSLVCGPAFASFTQGGPKPGDVYKEYSVNMTSKNWRVTDPNMDLAKHPAAAAFLPNPVISFNIDDLQGATRAEVVIDFWEGHDGTKDKRFRFNGKAWINIPEPVGIHYMQQVNHLIDIPLSHLTTGTNRLEGTCGPNSWDWGQWGWYGVVVRVYYSSSKPHATGYISSPAANATFDENPVVRATTSGSVSRVDFLAYYDGYDADGDGVYTGWQRDYHRASWSSPIGIRNHVGTAASSPYTVTWNTQWVPDQAVSSIRLVARIRDSNGYWSVSPVVGGLTLRRTDSSVKLFKPYDVPTRYWVRAGRTMSSKVSIPSLSSAGSAIMHVTTWNGNDGSNDFYCKVNNWTAPKYGMNHFYSYDKVSVPLSALKTGENKIEFHSKTTHHGIEIMWPGPAISVRYGSASSPPPPSDPTPDPEPAPDPTTSPLSNPGFESGMEPWTFYTNGAGTASAGSPAYEGTKAAYVTITRRGTNTQLFQSGLYLEPNKDYQLSFVAYSNSGRDLSVSLCKHGSPYTNYGISKAKADLSTGWKVFTINFRTRNFTSPVNDGRLFFWFADDALSGDQYVIDDVKLVLR